MECADSTRAGRCAKPSRGRRGIMHCMDISYPNDAELLRAEIAAAAARMIAEDGVDFGSAKRRAVKQILGNRKIRGNVLPDNSQIEAEVRIYNQLFFADTQPVRLLHLRRLALTLMQELATFTPYLVGAVLNGSAGDHSDIHLHLFAESAKDVEIYLLNKDVDFEVSAIPGSKPRSDPIEIVSFMWRDEGVHLTLFPLDDLRSGSRIERADARSVELLVEGSKI